MKRTFVSPFLHFYAIKSLLVCAFLALAFSCSRREDPKKSTENSLVSFVFTKTDNYTLSADVAGVIDQTGKTIAVELPAGTVVTALKPTIAVSTKATVNPASGTAQDFTNPVTYTVTAEGGTTQKYTVTVRLLTPFVSTWEVAAADLSVTLPLVDNGNYNFVVDWGDDTPKGTVKTKDEGIHTYAVAGTYTITITGTIEGFAFENGFKVSNLRNLEALKTRTISSWGPLKLGDTNGQFANAENLTITATDASGLLTKTTDLSGAFYGATKFNSDISGWDVSTIKNMSYMFGFASSFNRPLGSWIVSSVTDMREMFGYAYAFNQNIEKWDVSKVEDMREMFREAVTFDQNIGKWDVSKVTNMAEMFRSATEFNQNIEKWDVSQVTSMNLMFTLARKFDQNLSGWNVDKVTDYGGFAFLTNFDDKKEKWPKFKK